MAFKLSDISCYSTASVVSTSFGERRGEVGSQINITTTIKYSKVFSKPSSELTEDDYKQAHYEALMGVNAIALSGVSPYRADIPMIPLETEGAVGCV